MPSPRKHMDRASVPVLFRLPDLNAAAPTAERAPAAAEPTAAHASGHRSPLDHGAAVPFETMPPLTASPRRPLDAALKAFRHPRSETADASAAACATAAANPAQLWHRREIFKHPSAILLTMTIVAIGSWTVGRQMAGRQGDDATAAMQTTAPLAVQDALQGGASKTATTPADQPAPVSQTPGLANATPAKQAEPIAAEQPTQETLTSNSDSFYLPEDEIEAPELPPLAAADAEGPAEEALQSPELPALAAADAANSSTPAQSPSSAEPKEESPAVASQSATEPAAEATDSAAPAELASDALTPPANHPAAPAAEVAAAPAADVAATPAAEVSAAPAAEVAAAPAADQPEPSPASDQVAEKASATDGDAAPTAPSQEPKKAKLRRVLSSTPNDIPDWSRYLRGASQSIRAASAEAADEETSGTPPANQRAFYLDNDASF